MQLPCAMTDKIEKKSAVRTERKVHRFVQQFRPQRENAVEKTLANANQWGGEFLDKRSG